MLQDINDLLKSGKRSVGTDVTQLLSKAEELSNLLEYFH